MRFFVFGYVILAAMVAAVTTVLQIPPARWVIDWVADENGRFSIVLPVAAIFLALVLPLLLGLTLRTFLLGKNKAKVNGLLDNVGVKIKRKRLLFGAVYPMEIHVNGQHLATIANGRSVVMNLPDGQHELKIQSFGQTTEPATFSLDGTEIAFEIGFELINGKQQLYCRSTH